MLLVLGARTERQRRGQPGDASIRREAHRSWTHLPGGEGRMEGEATGKKEEVDQTAQGTVTVGGRRLNP